jgi:hypothetical protein
MKDMHHPYCDCPECMLKMKKEMKRREANQNAIKELDRLRNILDAHGIEY